LNHTAPKRLIIMRLSDRVRTAQHADSHLPSSHGVQNINSKWREKIMCTLF